MKLPESPNEMPPDLHNDQNWLRNTIVTLDNYSFVSLEWERFDSITEVTGEKCGQWSITIDTGRRRITAKHPEITNVLWYATTLADDHLEDAYNARIKARAEALAKLTDNEKRMLGL